MYVELFIKNQLPRLPPHIIIDICYTLENDYIFFFLSLKKFREVIIDHYFTKWLVLDIPAIYSELQTPHLRQGLSSIKKFLDENPDIYPREVQVSTIDEVGFRSFEELIRRYQQRLGKCNSIFYNLGEFDLTTENLKLITTCLPNVHKLELSDIFGTECLNDLKQIDFTKMINLSELNITGGRFNWSSIKLPSELKSFTMSSGQTDVTTIVLPSSIEHLSYNKCNINDDVLNQLQLPSSLKTLVLQENSIRRIHLSCLPRTLQKLDLAGNLAIKFPSDEQDEKKDLKWPPGLETLSLNDTKLDNAILRNLSSMGWPKSLKNLLLEKNELSSLPSLYNVPDTLEYLDISLSDTRIEDCTSPSDLTCHFRFPRFLDKLKLHDFPLRFERIKGSSERLTFPETLSALDLSFCSIKDLSIFQFPSSLKTLNLAINKISDLNGYNSGNEISWCHMTQLAELDLSYNRITDLSHWFPPPSIQELELYDNELTALTPETPIFDVEFNQIYTKLTHLSLYQNPIQIIGPRFCIPPSIRILELDLPSLKKFHITSGVLHSHLHELDLSQAHISVSYFIENSRSDPRLSKQQPSYGSSPISHHDNGCISDEIQLFYDALEASVGKKVLSRNSNVNSKHLFR